MSTVEREALGQQLRDFLAEQGGLGAPTPTPRHTPLSPEQIATLAAAGVTVFPGPPVVVQIVRERVVVPITPGMDCISEQQCVALGGMVRAIVESHHAPWQTVWSSLNTHMGVRSYRLIHAGAAPRAVAFLEHWRDTGLPPAH